MQTQITEAFETMKAPPGIGIFGNEPELEAYLAARQKMVEEGQ